MTEALQELAAHITDKQPDAVIGHSITHGELTVEVAVAEIDGFVEFLKADRACAFSTLVDITGVDWPERERRFDVVYHFLSMYQNHRIRVKAHVREEDVVPSIVATHAQRRLVRARGLRHVRDPVLRQPGPAPHPHRLRVPRASPAQGLPDHGLHRGAL
jgi:Ni,Fe-hydrogenase III component G